MIDNDLLQKYVDSAQAGVNDLHNLRNAFILLGIGDNKDLNTVIATQEGKLLKCEAVKNALVNQS